MNEKRKLSLKRSKNKMMMMQKAIVKEKLQKQQIFTLAVLKTAVLQSGKTLMDQGGRL